MTIPIYNKNESKHSSTNGLMERLCAPHVLQLFAHAENIEIQAIAEIGVFQGRCSKLFRKFFPDAFLYLVDPWTITSEYLIDGGAITLSQSIMNAAYLQTLEVCADDKQICILNLKSNEAVKYINQPLDLVYIDGDHSYANVIRDIELWMPKIRAGGIIAGHDYAHPRCPEVKPAIDDVFSSGVHLGPDFTWMKIVSFN